MDDLIETAIANIDALEKEMERWIVIGETHQALAISNQMVTTDIANLLGSSLVQGFWQPVAFGTKRKTESCFDTARVGALHVRLDEIEDRTLVNTGILLRKTKRAKQEANMEARHMLLGRAAGPSGASLMIPFLNGGSPGASTSGSLNTARYPPSLPPPPHASSNASSEPLVLPGVVSSLDPGTMYLKDRPSDWRPFPSPHFLHSFLSSVIISSVSSRQNGAPLKMELMAMELMLARQTPTGEMLRSRIKQP